eukprot:CAMPEP_0170899102 /NCGR_PEP_ID=MMETSP0734-20130129/46450_1 /TAXON_ID=186038 /ORGANISM="Fragilariopsis kerguelensis, Strain L26-C5" /LENGTH=571 /DNA_ID=CAMNT_0011291991 /DNA_START=63 /DNA_END=1779 /DNA_ORIENTATION=-
MTPGSVNTTLQHMSRTSAFTQVEPVLTPRETPRGTSMGFVLLSPARTITESLNTLASSTAQQLEEIWNEVGYTQQERASQLSDLLEKFRNECEKKISEEQGVAETFRQTIRDNKEEIKNISNALKHKLDPHLLRDNNGEMTLNDELANLTALSTIYALTLKLQEMTYVSAKFEIDLTAIRREEFHEKVEEMKQEVATRTAAVIQLLQDCQHLMNDIGINGQSDEASSLDRCISGSLVRSKDSSFIMASKFETETCTGISANTLKTLTSRASELSSEKRRRKDLLQDMGGQIATLWEQLKIPQKDQQAFTNSVKGLGMDTIEKGQDELKRLKNLKGQMLDKLINEARDNIQELWKETNGTYEQRKSFKPFTVRDEDMYDDELLDQHEEYIKTLHYRLEKMRPIHKIIERREDILRERMEYEELQKDSDRLKQRGSAMAKQLMEEEKMARRIRKDLPKLTKVLYEKLAEWKDSNDEDFQYRGEIYIEVMFRQDEEWTEYKKNEMHLKLKKKQDHQTFEDNRHVGISIPTKKKLHLGDSSRINNIKLTRGIDFEEKKPLRMTNKGSVISRKYTS